MAESISPNMNLVIPGVNDTPGPDYASDVNTSLLTIDSHDHSSGNGVLITPSGLNINTDLPVNSNNLTGLKSLRFTSQASTIPASSPNIDCIYVSGADLYYNDGNNNQVRITQSGAVAGSPGSISNLASPASASYSAIASTFTWQSDANTPATMDMGNIVVRNDTANSHGITIAPNNSIASDYTLTLPATLPGARAVLTVDSSGNISTIGTVSSGINASSLTAASITNTQIAAGTILKTNLAALGQQISASSGPTFSTAAGSPAMITNQTVTITTTGRPVYIALIGDTFQESWISLTRAGGMNMNISCFRNAFGGANCVAAYKLSAAAPQNFASHFATIDVQPAGTYTYFWAADPTSNLFNIAYVKTVVYEL